jgi:DNA modification methylase
MDNIQTNQIITGDCLSVLKTLPNNSIHCCVTSPPYYFLRDYETEGQIGREDTPEEYIRRLLDVFREVRRVLRADGTFWLNIADTYCKCTKQGYKKKDMFGIPWRVALALRHDGWYLRSDVIWVKGNTLPESVKDRCTRCYEHIFLLSKSEKYYYDHIGIAEPVKPATITQMNHARGQSQKYAGGIPGQLMQSINKPRGARSIPEDQIPTHRNKRDVWYINTAPYKGAHFATFPLKLAETCILAGCPVDGIVLDPFFGSGTAGLAAKQNNRHYIGIEINPNYCKLAEARINGTVCPETEAS